MSPRCGSKSTKNLEFNTRDWRLFIHTVSTTALCGCLMSTKIPVAGRKHISLYIWTINNRQTILLFIFLCIFATWKSFIFCSVHFLWHSASSAFSCRYLPTTPFLLLTAALYVRSSPRLYNRLLHHKYLGSYIRNFRENKAIPLRAKIISVSLIWITILNCIFFIVPYWWLKAVLLLIAAGTSYHILSFKNTEIDSKKRSPVLYGHPPVYLPSASPNSAR